MKIWSEKLKAASIHAFLSLIVVSIFYLLIKSFWFPDGLSEIEEPWKGVKLILIVDLILGPVLTFVVFNQNKARKELVIDIGLIALIQVLGLCWGAWQVYTQKPQAIVFWEERFYVVRSSDFEGVKPDFSSKYDYKVGRVPVIYAAYPDSKAKLEELKSAVESRRIPYTIESLYKKIELNMTVLRQSQVIHQKALPKDCAKCYLIQGKYHMGVLDLEQLKIIRTGHP